MNEKSKCGKVIEFFACCTSIWLLFVLVYIILRDHWIDSQVSPIKTWQEIIGLLIAVVVVVTLLAKFMKFVVENGETGTRILLLSYFALLVIVQSIIIISWDVPFTWKDINVTHSIASRLFDGGGFNNTETLYMARYQNNCGAVLLYSVFYKICSLFVSNPGIKCMMFFSTLFMDLGIYFIIATSGMIFGKKGKVIATFVSFFFSAFYFYAVLPYTDVFAFFCVATLVYIFYRYSSWKSQRAKILSILAFGLVMGVGSFVKGSVLILLLGVIVFSLLDTQVRRHIAKKVPFFVIAGIAVMGIVVAINVGGRTYVNHKMQILNESLEDQEFPVTHWFMLGGSKNGTYSIQDFNKTAHIKGKCQKSKMCLKESMRRYRHRTPKQLSKFIIHKNAYRIWHGGTFFYGFAYDRKKKTENLTGIPYAMMKVRSQDGYTYPTLIIWEFELLCIAAALWKGRKKTFHDNYLIICVIGINVFLNIWEANGRYLFQFVAVLYPLIIAGGLRIYNKYKQLSSRYLVRR